MIDQYVVEDISNALYSEEYRPILQGIENMDQLSEEIVRGLIKTDKTYILKNNPDICPKKYSESLLQFALDEGSNYGFILENLDKFDGVNIDTETRIIERLIQIYETGTIGENLEKLHFYDHATLATQLMTSTGIYTLVGYIEKFHGVDHNVIVDKLIEFGEISFLMENYQLLQGVDESRMIDHIFSTNPDSLHYVVANISKIKPEFHQMIIDKVLSTGIGHLITNNLYYIARANIDMQKIYDFLVEADDMESIAGNLEYFPNIDKTEFAKKLIAQGRGGDVIWNLEKFEGVSEDIIEQARLQS